MAAIPSKGSAFDEFKEHLPTVGDLKTKMATPQFLITSGLFVLFEVISMASENDNLYHYLSVYFWLQCAFSPIATKALDHHSSRVEFFVQSPSINQSHSRH
jgi:hypothetical protein